MISIMTPSEFFNEHTYYMWPQLLDNESCARMTEQVQIAYNSNSYYDTKPSVVDSIAQNNTKHIQTQGYTKKYRAIYGEKVKELTPSIYEYYTNPQLIGLLSSVTKCPLYPVPAYKTVDQAIQIYNQKGDGTNWHHDRSIFNGGRVFTFLTVIHNTSDQMLTIWTEKYNVESLKWSVGMAVLIEKFKTYHSVTPLNIGDRILVTLTYAEKPYTPSILRPVVYLSNKSKNYGYLGFDCFTITDWVIMILVMSIVIAIIGAIFYWMTKAPISKRKKRTK